MIHSILPNEEEAKKIAKKEHLQVVPIYVVCDHREPDNEKFVSEFEHIVQVARR